MFTDLDTEEPLPLEDANLNIEENNITFSIASLTENRHISVTVIATNAAGSNPSYTVISKCTVHPLHAYCNCI